MPNKSNCVKIFVMHPQWTGRISTVPPWPPKGVGFALSTLRHSRAGGFQYPALAVGKALDAVSGNFVENRVDFAADEIGRRKIVEGFRVFLSPKRAPGRPGGDQLAPGRGSTEAKPVEPRRAAAAKELQVGDSSEGSTQMGGMG